MQVENETYAQFIARRELELHQDALNKALSQVEESKPQKRSSRKAAFHLEDYYVELPLPKGRRLDLLRPQIVLPRQLP